MRPQIKPILTSRDTWTLYSSPQRSKMAKNYSKSVKSLHMILQNNTSQESSQDNMIIASKALKNNKTLSLLNLKVFETVSSRTGRMTLTDRFKKLNHLHKFKMQYLETYDSDQKPLNFIPFPRHLKSLTTLELNYNRMPETALSLRNFTTGLNHLKHLTFFSLLARRIPDLNIQDFKSFSENLKKCQYLQGLALDFWNCRSFTEKNLQDLASSIKSLENLSSISLNLTDCDNLNSTSIALLSKSLKESNSLKSLDISFPSPYFVKDGIDIFFQELAHFPPLTSLKFDIFFFQSDSNVSQDFIKNLSKALQAQNQLQILDIKMMQAEIKGSWAKHLVEAFKGLKNLSKFFFKFLLSKCLNDSNAQDLGLAISQLTNLSTLEIDLVEHNLGPKGIKKVLEGVANLKYLKNLYLDLSSRDSTSHNLQKVASLLPFYKSSEIKTLNSVLNAQRDNLVDLKLRLTLFNSNVQHLSQLSAQLASMKQLATLTLGFSKECSSKAYHTGLQDVFSNLKNIPKLADLTYYVKDSSDEHLRSFFVCLKDLRRLDRLYINCRGLGRFTSETASQFVEAAQNLESLSELKGVIDFEEMMAQDMELFMTSIPKISSLSVLKIRERRDEPLVPLLRVQEMCQNMKNLKVLMYGSKYTNERKCYL